MPTGRPTLYNPTYCERVEELGKLGKSPVQIAAQLNIDRTTLYSWGVDHPEFATALRRAKGFEQEWWENTAQEALKADKFQAVVWKTSMQARFREDYTERTETKATVTINHEDALDQLK